MHLIAFLCRFNMDTACGIIQSILTVILHILNDKGHAKGLKQSQQIVHFFFADRKGLIIVIQPCFTLMESQFCLIIFPRKRCHILCRQFQDNFIAVFNFFLSLLIPADSKSHNANDASTPDNTYNLLDRFILPPPSAHSHIDTISQKCQRKNANHHRL